MFDDGFVIAEAGTCHAAGRWAPLHLASEYAHRAFLAGSEAVKFQMFDDPNPETMFCWMGGDEDRAKRWRASRLSYMEWAAIKRLVESWNMMFLASAFEYTTVGWLADLQVKATKIASRAVQNFPDGAPPPYLISNGMYHVWEGPDRYTMQCEANYPSSTPWQGEHPGFSDHSGTPELAIDALERGCKIVEVHFYIDPEDAGPDLPASLNLDQLKQVCSFRDKMKEKS